MPRKIKRLGGKRKRSRFSGGRKLRQSRKSKTEKTAKKLHSAVQYGPRITPRSILAKLRWYNVYAGEHTNTSTFSNQGVVLTESGYYLRTWNLSSIFQPDIQNDNTGAGNKSVYHYQDYQPHYQKWMVRAAKVKGWFQSVGYNGTANSEASPTIVYLWADNNTAANVSSVDSNNEAFIQQGRRIYVLQNNTYGPRIQRFKRYYRHQKILKRKLDEDEDYGTITTSSGAAAGTDPPNNGTVYLHMLVINNSAGGETTANYQTFFSWAFDITFYTKLWDSPVDSPDTVDPDA